jgi:hypothetical protein
MQLDLKNPADLTMPAVRDLLASKDDSQHRQLRVTRDGIAYLSDKVGNLDTEGLAFRLETWDPGNGYCGVEAASDDKWVKDVFETLKENWPNPKCDYIDF